MKKIIFIVTVLLSFNASAAVEKCLRADGYGAVCIAPIDGKSWYENDIAVSIYQGDKLVHEMEGKSGKFERSYTTCGGKEHDCWTIPSRFSVSADDSHYQLILNLSPFGPSVNQCVRCSMSVLIVDGKYFKVH